jgi:hypothetical protein
MKKEKLGLKIYNLGIKNAYDNRIETKTLNVGFDNTIWSAIGILAFGLPVLILSILLFLALSSMAPNTYYSTSYLDVGGIELSHEDRFISIPFILGGLILTISGVMLYRKGKNKNADRIELVHNYLNENRNRGFIDIATISQKLVIQPIHVKGAIKLIILSGEINGYVNGDRFYFGIEGEPQISPPQMPMAHYPPSSESEPLATPPPSPETLMQVSELTKLLGRTINLTVPDFMDPDTTAQITLTFNNNTDHVFMGITVDTSDLSNFFSVEGDIKIPLLRPGMEPSR